MLKVNDILIAKDDSYMEDINNKWLTKDQSYKIQQVEKDAQGIKYTICSDYSENHIVRPKHIKEFFINIRKEKLIKLNNINNGR